MDSVIKVYNCKKIDDMYVCFSMDLDTSTRKPIQNRYEGAVLEQDFKKIVQSQYVHID